jgi:cell division protein FtsB
MRSISRKGKISQFLYTKAALFVLIIMIAAASRAAWGVYQKSRETQENIRKARAELETLRGRKRFLESEIERLSSERGLEEEIRKRFPVVKEGEEVAVIVDEQEETTKDKDQAATSFFSKFLDIFRRD